MYVTVNDIELDGVRRPFEVFVNSKNLEHYAWVVALTRMISAVFRRGGEVGFVAEELKQVFDPRGGQWMNGRYVGSLVAAIGNVIERHMIETGFLVPEDPTRIKAALPVPGPVTAAQLGPLCPKCTQPGLVKQSGCSTCLHCGWSKCLNGHFRGTSRARCRACRRSSERGGAEYEARRCHVCQCRYPPFGFGPPLIAPSAANRLGVRRASRRGGSYAAVLKRGQAPSSGEDCSDGTPRTEPTQQYVTAWLLVATSTVLLAATGQRFRTTVANKTDDARVVDRRRKVTGQRASRANEARCDRLSQLLS